MLPLPGFKPVIVNDKGEELKVIMWKVISA